MNKQYKVFIVDDHAVVREGLDKLISQESDLSVCGSAEDGYTLMKALETCTPDVIVVDLSLEKSSGLDVIKNVKCFYPDISMIVLSMHDEQIFAERAIRAGASGYVMKCEKPKELINSIRKVANGKLHFSENMTTLLLHKAINTKESDNRELIETLSDREFQVFQLIGKGVSTKEIADILNLSSKTIDSFREKIKHKLNFTNSSELVQFAIKWINLNNLV
jgi:DNA-binding NarL/FixJ family response regulator